jgi:hypothetical protein
MVDLTLSSLNPVLAFRIQDVLGAGVALVADSGHSPIAIARPSNDNALNYSPAFPNFQISDFIYGIDADSTAQGFTITFNSEVEGTIAIGARVWFDVAGVPGALNFGRWTGGTSNSSNARSCSVTCNGVTAPYMMDGIPALTNAANLDAPADGQYGVTGTWHTLVTSVSTGAPACLFPVVKGTNTISWNHTGGGTLFEGFAIYWTGQTDWQVNLPRYTAPSASFNLAPVRSRLANAASRVVYVHAIGDSLCANDDNWAQWELSRLEAKYGMAQRWVRFGTPSEGSSDVTGQWNVGGNYSFTSALAGGATTEPSVIFGDCYYAWTQAQTGGGAIKNAIASSQWQLIYLSQGTNGGTFTITPTGGSPITVNTTGAANTFAIASGTFAANQANNALVIAKTETAKSAGVAILSCRIGPSVGVSGSRVCFPGTSWAVDFPTGATAKLASFLAAAAPDIILLGNVNNASVVHTSGTGLLRNYLVPFYAYVNTLIDSVSAGYTQVVIQDLHWFVNATVNAVSIGTDAPYLTDSYTFGSFPSQLGAALFYPSVWDLVQLGYFPRASSFSLVSFTNYSGGLRDQVYQLFNEGFFYTQTSSQISNFHFSTAGATICGSYLGDLITGDLPTKAELANSPFPAGGASQMEVLSTGNFDGGDVVLSTGNFAE